MGRFLPAGSCIAGATYACLAVVFALRDTELGWHITAIDVATAVPLFGVALYLLRRPPKASAVQGWIAALTAVVLANAASGVALHPSPDETLGLQAAAIASGYLLSRSLLYCAVLGAAFAIFGLGWAFGAPDPGWSEASVQLLAFAATGVFLHVGRRWQISCLEELRQENVARAAELDASEQRFRTLAENARDLVSVIDARFRFVYVSPRVREMLGYEPEELIGHDPQMLLASEEERLVGVDGARWWTGSDEVITFRCRRKDGAIVLHEVSAGPIARPEGPCLVLTSRDVTERRALEARLHDAHKHESLAVMAGGIAHDFNNLLTVVLGESELARDLASTPVAASLDRIVESVERARRLTGQLLAYAGGMPREERELDLAAEAEGVVDLLRSSIPGHAEIEFEFDPKPAIVRADPGQLQQLVLNLVLNAAESREAGPVRITIAARTEWLDARSASALAPTQMRPAGRYAALLVTDDGEGIDGASLGRVFDPFFTTKLTGRGLGLAAVLGVAREHGAGIRVESQSGKGSCFAVYFPAVEGAATAAASLGTDTRADLGPGCVLVVDDEPGVRRVIARSLEGLGLGHHPASCGEEAVEIVRRDRAAFRLAAIDLSMPGIDGIETRRRLRELCPDLPVLLMSGFDRPGALAASDMLGVGFLRKPFTQAQLAERVRELLGPH